MNANMYDGVSTAGPVPIIFSDDQQATIDALVSDAAQAHKDLTKINRYHNTKTNILQIRQGNHKQEPRTLPS